MGRFTPSTKQRRTGLASVAATVDPIIKVTASTVVNGSSVPFRSRTVPGCSGALSMKITSTTGGEVGGSNNRGDSLAMYTISCIGIENSCKPSMSA